MCALFMVIRIRRAYLRRGSFLPSKNVQVLNTYSCNACEQMNNFFIRAFIFSMVCTRYTGSCNIQKSVFMHTMFACVLKDETFLFVTLFSAQIKQKRKSIREKKKKINKAFRIWDKMGKNCRNKGTVLLAFRVVSCIFAISNSATTERRERKKNKRKDMR